MIRPSGGRDGEGSKDDLGGMKTEIFLQRGLDTPVNKPPDGQITGAGLVVNRDGFAPPIALSTDRVLYRAGTV
jgi:hypothetical protein